VGQQPACAKNCPTNSIQFGPLDELRERADARLARLHEAGIADARLYGRDPHDGVGGDGAFFLLLDEPEVYGLPPGPVVRRPEICPRCGNTSRPPGRRWSVGRSWRDGGCNERAASDKSSSDVTENGLRGVRPDSDAVTGVTTGNPPSWASGAAVNATALRPSQTRSSPPTTTSR
jgi:hypothetical protein